MHDAICLYLLALAIRLRPPKPTPDDTVTSIGPCFLPERRGSVFTAVASARVGTGAQSVRELTHAASGWTPVLAAEDAAGSASMSESTSPVCSADGWRRMRRSGVLTEGSRRLEEPPGLRRDRWRRC